MVFSDDKFDLQITEIQNCFINKFQEDVHMCVCCIKQCVFVLFRLFKYWHGLLNLKLEDLAYLQLFGIYKKVQEYLM